MTTITDLSDAVGAVAGGVGSSVVGVAGRRSEGSGVVVAPGRVLTNAHNVWSGSDGEVTVTFADGRTAVGKPLGVDADGDVAVLEVDTADTAVVDWASGADVAIGAPVFGVANPGGRGLRVTFGLVSGTQRSFRGPRGRRIAGSIEHTAPLLPGSSGGPIVDADGKLIGINTHRLGEGFYLAIPADVALRSRVDGLGKGESPKRVKLGVALAGSDVSKSLRRAVGLSEVDGLLVRGVEAESVADKAGLRIGDVLVEANGRALLTVDDLFDVLSTDRPISIRVLRGADEVSVTVSTS